MQTEQNEKDEKAEKDGPERKYTALQSEKPVSRNMKRHVPSKQARPKSKTIQAHTEPSEMMMGHQQGSQFNRKEYHNEQILKDIEKYPIKYKIMCEVFGCKPDATYDLHKEETSHIQDEYTKQKGLEYLRQGNARAKYSYLRDQREHKDHRTVNQTRNQRAVSLTRLKTDTGKGKMVSLPKTKVKISRS